MQGYTGNTTLGYIPSPVDLSHLQAARGQPQAPKAALGQPTAYDLRTSGLGGSPEVTPVRDQGPYCGSCWAHGTLAPLEPWLLKVVPQTWDLSENNLKESHGFDWGPCGGENADMSTAYMARRDGPIAEGDDPYFDFPTGCTSGLPIRKYLRMALGYFQEGGLR